MGALPPCHPSRHCCLPASFRPGFSNLDHLVHLKWLDLSFNNIKVIDGLDKLTELMDLSLYNNQACSVELTTVSIFGMIGSGSGSVLH